eukprot:1389891-Amorphochlora_amoeboformis.AAC.1
MDPQRCRPLSSHSLSHCKFATYGRVTPYCVTLRDPSGSCPNLENANPPPLPVSSNSIRVLAIISQAMVMTALATAMEDGGSQDSTGLGGGLAGGPAKSVGFYIGGC